MKFAPEGYPFILFFLAITALSAVFAPWASVVPLALALFMLYFFRDPERHIPDKKDIFVSPADGEIIVVREVNEPRHLNADVKQISIFMSPFNVHVNRAPCDGKVKKVQHNAGKFFAAYKDDASLKNENIEMVLETRYCNILVRQVAGFIARRAVCRKNEGDILLRGERYGIIKFSSRLDVYLPKNADVVVKLGDMVKAGETILAKI